MAHTAAPLVDACRKSGGGESYVLAAFGKIAVKVLPSRRVNDDGRQCPDVRYAPAPAAETPLAVTPTRGVWLIWQPLSYGNYRLGEVKSAPRN
jgi:hypothetical protein